MSDREKVGGNGPRNFGIGMMAFLLAIAVGVLWSNGTIDTFLHPKPVKTVPVAVAADPSPVPSASPSPTPSATPTKAAHAKHK